MDTQIKRKAKQQDAYKDEPPSLVPEMLLCGGLLASLALFGAGYAPDTEYYGNDLAGRASVTIVATFVLGYVLMVRWRWLSFRANIRIGLLAIAVMLVIFPLVATMDRDTTINVAMSIFLFMPMLLSPFLAISVPVSLLVYNARDGESLRGAGGCAVLGLLTLSGLAGLYFSVLLFIVGASPWAAVAAPLVTASTTLPGQMVLWTMCVAALAVVVYRWFYGDLPINANAAHWLTLLLVVITFLYASYLSYEHTFFT